MTGQQQQQQQAGKAITEVNPNFFEELSRQVDFTPSHLQTIFNQCEIPKPKAEGGGRRKMTRAELDLLARTADKYKLDPLMGQIAAFPKRGGGIQVVVPVDGWATIINRHPDCDGFKFIDHLDEKGVLISITAIMYRKNFTHPIEVTEYMAECRDLDKEPWRRWPRRLLRHKALIQGGRYAYGISDLIDTDEAERQINAGVLENIDRKPVYNPENMPDEPPLNKPAAADPQPEPEPESDPASSSATTPEDEHQAEMKRTAIALITKTCMEVGINGDQMNALMMTLGHADGTVPADLNERLALGAVYNAIKAWKRPETPADSLGGPPASPGPKQPAKVITNILELLDDFGLDLNATTLRLMLPEKIEDMDETMLKQLEKDLQSQTREKKA
jgi:hypothetical protein